ncbi:hypothetical protein FBZ96_109199 [Bradyrhizobium stylosanthis]|uniref:Uncharacterized protein n=1 Tax=Bradyrhizobium stylosanthis TaxID=1803665 RepID=A0A560D9M3_9BRAD|nr:hypothetical protein FBZ96_109199 [Bradyrhizobium stylosanthis]
MRGLLLDQCMTCPTRTRLLLATIERGAPGMSGGDGCHIPSAGQFTIQGMPNLSTHMPKPLAQNVLL